MTRISALLAALGAALLLAACGDDDGASASLKGAFAGKVTGSRAYVALVSDGRRVSGYVCDGERISRWLKPAAFDGHAAVLRGRDGSVVGSVRVAAGRASGVVDVGARRAAFTAVPARGEAGLYRQVTGSPGEPGYRESGWIVLADRSHRGATQFTSTDTDLVVGPAPKRTATASRVTSFTSNETDL